MIMKNDPKKVAAMILVAKDNYSGMRRQNEKVSQMPEVEEIDEGYVSAMDEFISAIESKDAKAAAMALKSFVQMCSSESTEDDAE